MEPHEFSTKYLFVYLFITFHRSKLGYNNLKDTEIFILLNTSDTI